MKVKLLVLFFLLMLFSISCSSSGTAETTQEQASLSGVLQSTKVLIQTDETYFSSVSRQELDDCFVRRILLNTKSGTFYFTSILQKPARNVHSMSSFLGTGETQVSGSFV